MWECFYQVFPTQLAMLEFRRPNMIVGEHIMRDPSIVFFGGVDWESVTNDLALVLLKTDLDSCYRYLWSS